MKHQYGNKPRLDAVRKPGLYKAGAPFSNY